MNRFFTRYLNRSGLTKAAMMTSLGIIALFKAYRRHDRNEAIVVVIIFFIVMPAFVLWASRAALARAGNTREVVPIKAK